MNKIKHILTGFWNWVFPNPKIEDMAQRRLRHCNGYKVNEAIFYHKCKHNENGSCNLCGCVLKAKTRVPDEECPRLLWGKEVV